MLDSWRVLVGFGPVQLSWTDGCAEGSGGAGARRTLAQGGMRLNELQVILVCFISAAAALFSRIDYAWIGPAVCFLVLVCFGDVHRVSFTGTFGLKQKVDLRELVD